MCQWAIRDYDRLLSAAILLAEAMYFFIGIRRRWKRETEFDQSFLGDLNKALWQVEYEIAGLRRKNAS